MKKILSPILLMISLVVSTSLFAQDKQEVEKAAQMAIETFNNRDFTAYQTYISDDIEVFTGVSTPFLHIGKANWLKFLNGLATLPSVNYSQQQNTTRVFNGTSAVINGYFLFTVVAKDGSVTSQAGRNTTVLSKQNGKWLIVNYHFSKIFE